MIQTNISLHQQQHDLIKKRCEENGCSLSWVIREALDDYFKTLYSSGGRKKKKKKTPKKSKVEEVKEAVKKYQTGVCKVCGAGLKPGGQYCMGKGNHKQ